MAIDLAVTFGKDGMVLHRVDCPDVRRQAAEGEPVMSMFGCKDTMDDLDDMKRHSCLKAPS